MINVIFLDDDQIFLDTVCKKLNFITDKFKCIPILISEIDLLYKFEKSKCIYIFDPLKYTQHKDIINKIYIFQKPDDSESSVNRIYKFTNAKNYILAIENFISQSPDLSKIDLFGHISCIVGNASSIDRDIVIMKLTENKAKEGKTPVILPLVPPYLLSEPFNSNDGYNLTEAFLRIIANDLESSDIGSYLVPDNYGNLIFRPVERYDDLFDCDSSNLQVFIKLIKNWIKESNYKYYLIINCNFIPFTHIYSISVMCNELIILNQRDHSLQNANFNKELSPLLANLPNSCKVSKEFF